MCYERHFSGVISSYLNFFHAQGSAFSFFFFCFCFCFCFLFFIDLVIVILHDPYFQFSEISHLLVLNKTPPFAAFISCCLPTGE